MLASRGSEGRCPWSLRDYIAEEDDGRLDS